MAIAVILAISVVWSVLGALSCTLKSNVMCIWFAVAPVLRFLTDEQDTFMLPIEQC